MWIDTELELDKQGEIVKIKNPASSYQPEGDEKDRLMMIRQDFTQGDVIMQRPRREFNDLCVLERDSIDQMAWAVYQPNDGDALEGDQVNGWRSNAVRPIVRNKIYSVAAHVTARTLFPKIIAFDKESIEQAQAAQIMTDLMEWSCFNTNSSFTDVSLRAVIAALVRPVSIVQTQYCEVYRTVKRKKGEDGKWIAERVLDEDLSGFIDESVPCEQVYIQDFYQPDIQKQGWLIRRRVRPYTLCKAIYGTYANFEYVSPGIQVIYNDANQEFYDAYDTSMHQDECEEVLYWNKSLDLFQVAINGVLLTDPENPNPREDKLYPFAAFGYEYLRANGDSFYYKSLAFKTMPDDKIVNTLYPMIIDGTYLAIMPPMINRGGEIIESDVIVPGGVTTFSSSEAGLDVIGANNDNLKAGMDALFKVEENITDDAFQPLQQGDLPNNAGNMPAYTLAKLEATQKLMLGPFVDMVGRYVKQMGRLKIGDIKQHLTLPEVTAIEGSADADLVYKTFVLPSGKARSKSKKIKFSIDMPTEPIPRRESMNMSYEKLQAEDHLGGTMSLADVNPVLFRDLSYIAAVGVDVLAPMSEELEAQWNLQTYDRMVMSPNLYDPEETAKLLMESSPTTKRHPEKYVAKNPSMAPMSPGMPQPALQPAA